MKSIQTLLLNLLVGLNAFILFFLLFEDRIVLPVALQVLGRMHPLLLHFPIVLLTLAWLLACFGNRWVLQHDIVRRLVYALLFVTAWSAAITVLAGLLLSKEGGYEGSSFLWHKWMGVALCFSATALLWSHGSAADGQDKYRPLFLWGISLSLVILILAGHFGASLTHGADYLMEPLRRNKQKALDVETAVLYPDLIYPILQTKCLGCHSNSKSKGGLILTDTASVLKGGDSGPVLVKGATEESLLIERLLLDLDHEHRMPPKGKPQLTPAELALIEAWIATGADFSTPLSALPIGDTIHALVEAVYGPPVKETYDFPAADAKVIEKLATPYRAIKPLSQSSPALHVGFYGKAFYTEQALQELSPISQQVVSLALNGMPLSSADKGELKSFVNLRELVMNDTPIDDTWAETLAQLPALRHISLSSTNITEAGLTMLLSSTTIRAVYVWNTGIDVNALETLQQKYRDVRIERGYVDDGNQVLPLNDPVVAPKSSFFRDEIQVLLSHPISGVELRYTLDGTEPDSVHGLAYTAPISVKSPTVVKTKAYKSGWLSSQKATRTFHRSLYRPSRVTLANRPHPKYRGREALALFDLESGGDSHLDGKWLGFHGQQLVASMHFDAAIDFDAIGINVKQNYGIHIYPPKTVEIWGGVDSTSAKLLARFRPELAKPGQASSKRMVDAVCSGKAVKYLRVVAEPYGPIPTGYPGEGNPAWIFVDELVMY